MQQFHQKPQAPKTHFLIPKVTFLVMAHVSFRGAARAHVLHSHSLGLENVKPGCRLSFGWVSEVWVSQADRPELPLVQCCILPRRARSKLEVTLQGTGKGGCFRHSSLLLPLDLVPPRDHVPPRSTWDCRTVGGRSRHPKIAGLGPKRGSPRGHHPTASEPENSAKLCHIKSHLNASIYVTASGPPGTQIRKSTSTAFERLPRLRSVALASQTAVC